ncbi:hypothetical protein ACX0G9_03840 [Flavitalea flava]
MQQYQHSFGQKAGNRNSFQAFRVAGLLSFCCLSILAGSCNSGHSEGEKKGGSIDSTAPKAAVPGAETPKDAAVKIELKPIDTALYNKLVLHLANGDSSGRWPVKAAYPKPGAVFPFTRVVAYYGNFYSKKMGVLGEYPPDEMLKKLAVEVKKWEAADPSIPVRPAIHYIAATAQGSPGKDGKYRLRMPFKQIDSAIGLAARINALVFLDVQVGFSNVQAEIPQLEKYLKMPNVHLGIDPEFSMKTGKKPGTVIGTMDASDVNFVTGYLEGLAKANNLPPKILVVHRFTRKMVTNYKQIVLRPDVQIVMDMDGWGEPTLKRDSYKSYVANEPVQFTGFKLFYKNDIRKQNSRMLTPEEVLKQKPSPIYIQYQ